MVSATLQLLAVIRRAVGTGKGTGTDERDGSHNPTGNPQTGDVDININTTAVKDVDHVAGVVTLDNLDAITPSAFVAGAAQAGLDLQCMQGKDDLAPLTIVSVLKQGAVLLVPYAADPSTLAPAGGSDDTQCSLSVAIVIVSATYTHTHVYMHTDDPGPTCLQPW